MTNDRSILFERAADADVDTIAALLASTAQKLTRDHGKGHWSSPPSARSVALAMKRGAAIMLARKDENLVATLTLSTRKPWAIDPKYFTPRERVLYLTQMGVAPNHQRTGIGRACIEQAMQMARTWPVETIRLDAYDAQAGASGFYEACGFREVGRVSYRKTPLVYLEKLV
jgi:GNAT superfamily N-acetyltransferase